MVTEAIAPIPNMAPKHESLKDKFLRYILGEDIFISYSRQDGTTYALALARELSEQNYSCKFDQWGTAPGKDLPKELQQSLRRSTVLVLGCTEQAAKSESVGKEINIFLETGRYIIPIDVDGSLATSVWQDRIFGIPPSLFAKNVITEAKHGATEPSDEVLRRISDTFTYRRKNERLGKAAIVIAVAIGFLIVVALAGAVVAQYQVNRATDARNEAIQATERADQAKLEATKAAAEAQKQTERAETERKRAEEQTRIANNAIEQSKIARDEADKQTLIASEKRREAAAQAEKARQLTYASNMQLASRIYNSGDVEEFDGLLEGTDDSLRGFEWHYLKDLPRASVNFDQSGHNVGAVLFSPDGKYLVTRTSDNTANLAQLWDVQKGGPVETLRDAGATDFAFSPDGKWFASCGVSTVALWNTTSWTKQVLVSIESTARRMAHHAEADEEFELVSFSADSRELLTVSDRENELLLRRWSTETGKQIGSEQSISKKFPGEDPEVKRFADKGQMIVQSRKGTFLVGSDLSSSSFQAETNDSEFRYAFFPDGRVVLVKVDARDPRAIEIRDRDLNPKSKKLLEDSTSTIEWKDITVSSNGKLVAAVRHGEVRIWNTETLKPIKVIFVQRVAKSISFSLDGSEIAVGGYDEEFENDSFLGIWNTGTSDNAFTFNGERFLAASTDGTKVLSTRIHQDIHLWNVVTTTSQKLATDLQSKEIAAGGFSPDASRVWAFIQDRNAEGKGSTSLRVWNVANNSEIQLKSETECKHAKTTEFSSDGKRLVGFCADGTIRVWSMDDGKELTKLAGEDAEKDIQDVLLTPTRLIVFYKDKPSRYWDLKTGPKQPFEVCSEEITQLSPNGEWSVTRDEDGNYLRKVGTKECGDGPVVDDDSEHFQGVDFSRDGKFVAVFSCTLPSGTGDCVNSLMIRTLTSDPQFEPVDEGLDTSGGDVQFSPSGRWVQFGSQVWDRKKRERFSIVGCASSLIFAEDQNRFMTTCADGTLKFGSLTSGQELFALKAHNSAITETILLPGGRQLLTTNGNEVKLWRGILH